MPKKDKKRLTRRKKFLLLPIIFLAIFLSLLIVDRAQGYLYYERVEFNCGDTKLHANIYHPTKNLDFQDKHPLIIYIHGFSGQKDRDLRVPLELTKRGFYVASVDMPGHGENANSDLLDIEDGEFVTTQMCSKLLDKIENMGIYSQIDKDQIGLLGFSYGGYVALMNGLDDDRFKVTITWAGVADVTKPYEDVDISDRKEDLLEEYNPVDVMNNGSKQPDNLLLIVHKEDYWYKYNKRLQDRTDCEWEVFTYPVRGVGEAHLLLHKNVMIETINWFEKQFFESTSKNGSINLSYQYSYLILFLTLLSGVGVIISFMIYSSKYILKKDPNLIIVQHETKQSSKLEDLSTPKKKQIIIIIGSLFSFIIIWILVSLIFLALASLFAPLIFILIYFLLIRRFLFEKDAEIDNKISLKERVKSENTKRSLIYSGCFSVLFLALYFVFALAYPFWLFYPHSIVAIIIAMIYIPLYLSVEILYRKIIYPSLGFIKSKKNRTYIITGITIFTQIFLLYYTLLYFTLPVLIATGIVFLAVSIINGVIYHKTEKIEATLLDSLIIMTVFYGAAWSFILNLILIIS
jgi:dienelactone hydrolase